MRKNRGVPRPNYWGKMPAEARAPRGQTIRVPPDLHERLLNLRESWSLLREQRGLTLAETVELALDLAQTTEGAQVPQAVKFIREWKRPPRRRRGRPSLEELGRAKDMYPNPRDEDSMHDTEPAP